MTKIEELRDLTLKELQDKLVEIRLEQFNLRFKKANGALDKTHLIPKARKAVARIKTIMSEKVRKGHDE
jgi:large subunit ribosomal protein L29